MAGDPALVGNAPRFYACALIAAVSMGCVGPSPGPDIDDDKADGHGTCEDPRYGDGTCQVDLACGIPDIDCFLTFPSDRHAATWALRQPGAIATQALEPTDPRVLRSRSLVDRAWRLVTAAVPLGLLAAQRPAVVVVVHPAPNAFVIQDQDSAKAALSVQITEGLLATSATDEELIGTIIHELAHLTTLNVFPDVADRRTRHYIAPPGREPIGARQPDDPRARQALAAWTTNAAVAGPYSADAFGGFPLGGLFGTLFWEYVDRNSGCPTERASVGDWFQQLTRSRGIDESIALTPTSEAQLASALMALRTCLRAESPTLGQFLSENNASSWAAQIRAALTPDEAGLLAQPALDAIVGLIDGRRAKLRQTETAFRNQTGRPWSALRFYSSEEEADDVTVRATLASGFPEPGVSGFMLRMLGGRRAACETALANGQPFPYSVNLLGAHHGLCWRVGHARQLAAESGL